ncbi:hypothetical protein QE443_002616 [Pantoea ananatis]|uniref:Rrf2 family transcriptional regulator n=1 Tax=Pantoea ananas TaxID=553 RepID=UPI00277D5DC8|nr:Rrf2 family transcriptional regulator [Pantoea ananatis]MDQ1226455.1 hypothetical protein [Pantoea ananatis]MDR6088333.1 hypothetical protein [Pantoea ananatis]
MQVSIKVNKKVLWVRNDQTKENIFSQSYLKDGTQQKIIAALEDALCQAKAQAGL